jgi:hypothetical protein
VERSRKLRLVRETLTELTDAELRAARAGTDGTEFCNPCIVSWSCNDFKTYRCLQTHVCTV